MDAPNTTEATSAQEPTEAQSTDTETQRNVVKPVKDMETDKDSGRVARSALVKVFHSKRFLVQGCFFEALKDFENVIQEHDPVWITLLCPYTNTIAERCLRSLQAPWPLRILEWYIQDGVFNIAVRKLTEAEIIASSLSDVVDILKKNAKKASFLGTLKAFDTEITGQKYIKLEQIQVQKYIDQKREAAAHSIECNKDRPETGPETGDETYTAELQSCLSRYSVALHYHQHLAIRALAANRPHHYSCLPQLADDVYEWLGVQYSKVLDEYKVLGNSMKPSFNEVSGAVGKAFTFDKDSEGSGWKLRERYAYPRPNDHVYSITMEHIKYHGEEPPKDEGVSV